MLSIWRGMPFALHLTWAAFMDSFSYVYYTQIMQAETLASAYRLWRRNWKGPGREYTAGALVWQVGATFTQDPHNANDADPGANLD